MCQSQLLNSYYSFRFKNTSIHIPHIYANIQMKALFAIWHIIQYKINFDMLLHTLIHSITIYAKGLGGMGNRGGNIRISGIFATSSHILVRKRQKGYYIIPLTYIVTRNFNAV